MGPQEISALMTLLGVLKHMSSWPFGLIIFLLIIGPWLLQFIFWRMDSRRFQQLEKAREKELSDREAVREKELHDILKRYREDVSEIKKLYESNARLVTATNEAFKRLENIYSEAISIISLNTDTQRNLVKTVENNVKAIENNRFCPMAGPDLQRILNEFKRDRLEPTTNRSPG